MLFQRTSNGTLLIVLWRPQAPRGVPGTMACWHGARHTKHGADRRGGEGRGGERTGSDGGPCRRETSKVNEETGHLSTAAAVQMCRRWLSGMYGDTEFATLNVVVCLLLLLLSLLLFVCLFVVVVVSHQEVSRWYIIGMVLCVF